MEYIKIITDSKNIRIEDDIGRSIHVGQQLSDGYKITIDELAQIDVFDEIIDEAVQSITEEIEQEYEDIIKSQKEEIAELKQRTQRTKTRRRIRTPIEIMIDEAVKCTKCKKTIKNCKCKTRRRKRRTK